MGIIFIELIGLGIMLFAVLIALGRIAYLQFVLHRYREYVHSWKEYVEEFTSLMGNKKYAGNVYTHKELVQFITDGFFEAEEGLQKLFNLEKEIKNGKANN